MNTDGYTILEINLKGEARHCESQFFDVRLKMADFDTDYITESLKEQLPNEMNDILVMCFFKYRSESSYDHWGGGTEYEENFDLINHQTLITNYKEFYRIQVSEDIGTNVKNHYGLFDDEDELIFENIVSGWEEFYGEDFVPIDKRQN